jgi:hypothetical protein
MDTDEKYEELNQYATRAVQRIVAESISENVKAYAIKRREMAARIRALITDVRMLDREISLEAQESWRDLPVIEG